MPLRIAHVLSTPAGLGGAERLVAALARASAGAGHHVIVLNAFQAPAMGTALVDACAPVPVRSTHWAGIRDLPRLRRWTDDQLSAFAPDVVHVHLARALVLVATLRRPGRASMVVTHHHGELFVREQRRLAAAVDAVASRRYDVVVAVSPAVGRVLLRHLHVPRRRLRVIANGWEGTPQPRRPAAPARLVCTGRLRREKGHDVLLHALAELHRSRSDVHLDLLGDGPLRPALEALAGRLGVADAVTFHGDVDDVWPVLATATVAVQPSRVEALGIATLEASAAGLPVVASRTGGLVDVVEDGVTGSLVPVGAPGALARAVQALLDSPERAQELGRAGARLAADFRLEATLDRYQRLYEELRPSGAVPR